jgi:tRNA(fMet)-specific endonuclease VapC
MKIAMLDTNVLLDIMYNEKKALEKLQQYSDYEFIISFLVFAEIMAGSQIRVKADTRKFLQRFTVKEYDTKAHTIAKKLLNKYFTGRENKPMDLLIAAHAKSLNVPIITNNAKDFLFSEIKVHHYTK